MADNSNIPISHAGMFTDGGIPVKFALGLAVGIRGNVGFQHFGCMTTRTPNQGEVQLCQPGQISLGPIIDVSPKGDTGTVQIYGFEWVVADMTNLAVAGLVTVGVNGILIDINDATVSASDADRSGIWQIDALDLINSKVLIAIEGYL